MPHQCTTCGRTFPDGSKEMLSGCPDCGGNKFQFAPSSAVDGADGGDAGSDVDQGRTGDDRGVSEGSDPSDRNESDGLVSRAAETVRDRMVEESSTADRASPAADGNDSDETAEFDEWPDTARPPEDRDQPSESPPAVSDPSSAHGGSETTSESDVSQSSPEQSSQSRSTDLPAVESDASTPDADSGSDSPHPDEADTEDSAQANARSEVVSPEELPGSGDGERPPEHGRVVSEPSGEDQSLEDLREELNDQFESIKILSPGQYELNLMELYDREEYIVSLQEDGRYVINVPDSWREGDE